MNFELVLFLLGGLSNVAGAVTIALPDVPRIRLVLWSERVREGIYEMEANGLTKEKTGFREVGSLLTEIYDTEVPIKAWGYRAGFHTLSRYGFETVYLFTDQSNEDKQIPLGKDTGEEIDYRVARTTIKHQINNYQATVRGTGFLLIALGFALQVIGRLM